MPYLQVITPFCVCPLIDHHAHKVFAQLIGKFNNLFIYLYSSSRQTRQQGKIKSGSFILQKKMVIQHQLSMCSCQLENRTAVFSQHTMHARVCTGLQCLTHSLPHLTLLFRIHGAIRRTVKRRRKFFKIRKCSNNPEITKKSRVVKACMLFMYYLYIYLWE